ncbi:hypothetical protein [Propionispora hippei]|uniref:Uncharacterized protein n=1 Tax=Propionispora hippei DSM 15287 TaxID=1123003 RepID=A0A1M6KND6_9FIRM|nr:hypothetical protein [Propionispora hippei]SHJ60431.1 hypothetical protein SAMN02745170_02910 [Propionispora hippei DSM 15287]
MGYSVIVKIATAGARYQEENGEIIQSLTGHVWLTLRNDETGQEFNFGFHPSVEGSMYTSPGLVRNDDWRYLDVTYQRSLAVSANQYNTLYQNCQAARADNTFGDYIGGWNACPDFAFQELWQAGIGTQSLSLDGTNMAYDTPQSPSAWPAANVSLLNAMANYNERYIAPALEGNYNDLRDRVSQLDEGYAMIVGGGLWEGKVPDDYIFQGWVTDGSGKTYPSYSPPYDNVQSTINVTTTTSITTPAQITTGGRFL